MAQASSSRPKKMVTGGDDLDDGLELDPTMLASSDAEDDDDGEQGGQLNDEEEVLLPGDERVDDDDEVHAGVKRKAADDDESEDGEAGDAKADKKKRRKEREKERKAKKREEEDEERKSGSPTLYTVPQLSDLLLGSIRDTFPAASSMEIDDYRIPEERLLPPPDYSKIEDSSDPFTPLLKRLDALLNPLQKKKLKPSTPRVIILSSSGLRCADVVRRVRSSKGEGEVAKLFAKHFKLEEQANHLAKTKVSIAVGTPSRVGKLIEQGALKITSDTVLLLEISYVDTKKRTLFSIPEVRTDLWKTVFGGPARESLFKGGVRIGAC